MVNSVFCRDSDETVVEVPLHGLVEYVFVCLSAAVDQKGLRLQLSFPRPENAGMWYMGEDRVRAACEEMIQKLVKEMR